MFLWNLKFFLKNPNSVFSCSCEFRFIWWRKKSKRNSVHFSDRTTQILRTAEQLNDGKRKIIINFYFVLLYSGFLFLSRSFSCSIVVIDIVVVRIFFVCARCFVSFRSVCAVPCVRVYLSIFILKLTYSLACTEWIYHIFHVCVCIVYYTCI